MKTSAQICPIVQSSSCTCWLILYVINSNATRRCIFFCPAGVSLRSIRSRFAFLKSLNSDVERLLLPVTDLRAGDCYNLSTAALLREARGLLFYHTKVALLNHVLNQTAHRGTEDSPPEVSLDPLESLEGKVIANDST